MLYFLAILSGILPALVLIAFIYWQDKYRREPVKWILKSFWYGMMACAGAVLLEILMPDCDLDTLEGDLFYSFVVIAFSEEIMRLFFFWLLVRRNPYFDERMDGIVYAACVGMGLAGLENIGYLLISLDDLAFWGVARALFSVPGHFFYGVFMGFYYSLAIYGSRRRRVLYYLLAFLVPWLYHGIFDCSILVADLSDTLFFVGLSVFLVVFVLMIIMARRHILRLLHADNKLMHKVGLHPAPLNSKL